MLEFKVTGIGIDTRTDNPLVILHSKGAENDLILPIWIGRLEAQSIAIALQEEKLERPLTHDLMLSTIETLNYKVDRVVVHSVINGTFFAHLILQHKISKEETVLDARPSDCIALALRAACPVFVTEIVQEESCIPAVVQTEEGDERPEGESIEKEEFLKFLDGVKASDFKLPPEEHGNLNS
ncbi:MAG: bifunctional nuclease family protein [Candidatus Caenarcaniphilales bacterium]|nr:bifunctional nuclease family protein [Candidatus Caenarcaniphilales bacterium]